jgi:phosphatidylserine/phosphatidylglycerophosphate/cardiolipin synthase-like enzyme
MVRPLVDGRPAFRRICEAIEAAQHSVFVTIAFLHTAFAMPDGRGSFFDVLDRAFQRGLDVRGIFWRNHPKTSVDHNTVFSGLPRQLQMLGARGSRFGMRWDQAAAAHYCQHQKSWIIDAGRSTEVAFVGGINLNPKSLVNPGHCGSPAGIHDAYVEIAGPAATDVYHNFVQRWNEASERNVSGGCWGESGALDLAFPTRVAAPCGDSLVQIQRTVTAGKYADGCSTPWGRAFNIAHGDLAIFAQYRQAIDAAQRTIYIENQALEHPEIVAQLDTAVERGVEVVALVPAEPEASVRAVRQRPESKFFYQRLAALGRKERFTLVDDTFVTIGSCNIRARSFFGHTEMNASIYDPMVVRALRRDLFAEHLNLGRVCKPWFGQSTLSHAYT